MAINKQMSAKSDQAARLRAAREAAGFKSASDAAQRFRWRASTYMAHENGQNGIRAPEPALTYARVYGVDLNWLLTGIGPGPAKAQAAQRGERQRSSRASRGPHETGAAPANAIYSAERWPRDLRVLGMAECGPDGWSLWNGEVIEMTSRPPNLAGAALAYAVYVVGDSMEPRYHSGELVYVHPGRPVDVGAYVLVQVRPRHDGDAPRAVVKRLVRRSATKVTLEQFNPKKTIELKSSDIISIHRVVGSGEA
ncbi:MAG TPA: LexA family transcriptional regulator [Rhizomicrobium sp.]|nr:LexA family transcriptional regulator [Rhizomicrobium sp.]